MKPMTMHKVINGERWSYANYRDTKTEARDVAKHVRQFGYNARITKEKSPMGKVYYAIWQRKKGRR